MPQQPKSIIVVGSGAIGVEFAYFYKSLGTEVTIVEFMPRLVPVEDEEVSKELERCFRKKGLKVMTNASVEKVEKSGEDRLEVTGDLNLHGVTRQIVLDVKGPTNEIRDLLGHMRRGASAVTQINRTDFGINWNKTLEAGGVAVGEEVMIGLEIEMIRK